MEITNIKIKKEDHGRIKGICSILLDGEFLIHGIRIIEGKDRMFVSMPSRKEIYSDDTGVEIVEHVDICHPINTETRRKIEDAILKEFQNC